jgi:hypothetical protein
MNVLDGEWTSARIVGDPHSSLLGLPSARRALTGPSDCITRRGMLPV